MTDGRSPRIHLLLTIWALLLIGLVLVDIRHLPPGLTLLLLPYLALMAWHWIGRLRQRAPIRAEMPLVDADGSSSDDEQRGCADRPGIGDHSGGDDSPIPVAVRPDEEPVTPLRRSRTRRRPRVPEAEPSAASWVQVGPGRFVRVEEMAPERPVDESDGNGRPDEPRELISHDEVATAPEELISTDTCDMVTDPEAGDADRDVPDAIIPEQPGEGSAERVLSPDRHAGDARGNHAWNGSWIVQLPQGDPGS